MKTNEADVLATVDRIAVDVISKHAISVDTEARFPAESMKALADAGIWGVLSSPEVGGLGLGFGTASRVIRRVGRECGSTAMVLTMHYAAVNVLEAAGAAPSIRHDCASGAHLTTLAFSEAGSRSQFWAPTSTAKSAGEHVRLDAHKSWVTSAPQAQSYVWSSQPLAAEGLSSIWLVPSNTKGLQIKGPFNGLGLRGNESSPVLAEGVEIPKANLLGEDGKGFDVMMGSVLPIFQLLNASCSLGLMQAAVERTIAHASGTSFQHTGSALRDLPTIRSYIARMKVETDMVETLLDDTASAIENGREDTMLRVLECKAAAGESAFRVLDTAMRVCGGAAFRKEVGVERAFRDGRAAGVMAPTTDVLYDFIGKAVTGMDLVG
jgi:alkylation response protein AidB-like acyl-CoA dehydrogenase